MHPAAAFRLKFLLFLSLLMTLGMFIQTSTHIKIKYRARRESHAHKHDLLGHDNAPDAPVAQLEDIDSSDPAAVAQIAQVAQVPPGVDPTLPAEARPVKVGRIPYNQDWKAAANITMMPKPVCEKQLPDFLIVGAEGGGALQLFSFLGAHPKIVTRKDARFFDQNFHLGLDWYRDQMPCSWPDQITIEMTLDYFYNRSCPVSVLSVLEHVKIIVVLKSPIVRARAQYEQDNVLCLLNTNEILQLEFEDIVAFRNGTLKPESKYITQSKYEFFIGPWLTGYGLSNILIVDGAQLEQNPSEELQKVEEFLGIDFFFTASKFLHDSPEGKTCFKVNDRRIHCVDRLSKLPPIDSKVNNGMRQYFRPHNERFFKLIGRRFEW